MITKFNHWKIFEHLGDGNETFTQKVEMYGKIRNLDIYGCPSEWGESIDTAVGELTYSVQVEVKNSGIDDIYFTLEKLALDLEIVTGQDADGDDIIASREYVVEAKDIKTDVEVEIHDLPFDLNNLEILFDNAENLDGDFLPEKVTFKMEIGSIKS